jgi:hypothetical protein
MESVEWLGIYTEAKRNCREMRNVPRTKHAQTMIADRRNPSRPMCRRTASASPAFPVLAILLVPGTLLLAQAPESERATVRPPNVGLEGGLGGHWGVKDDRDWVDARWSRTDTGPFFSSSLETPSGVVRKSISVRLGASKDVGMAFDTETLEWRAAWSGGFIEPHPDRFGLIQMPRIRGRVLFHPPPAEERRERSRESPRRFLGLRIHGERVVFEYEIEGSRFAETVEARDRNGWLELERTIAWRASVPARRIAFIDLSEASEMKLDDARRAAEFVRDGQRYLARSTGAARWTLASAPLALFLEIPAQRLPGEARVICSIERSKSDLDASSEEPDATIDREREPTSTSIDELLVPGPRRWGGPIVTRGTRGSRGGAWEIDTLTMPYENPWGALLFASGHDFFSDGSAAISTVHGDVWIVRGIDESLERLEWQRFATGLYQPLGLEIVGDRVHVLGRDRITRLYDENHDGEADRYESFCDTIDTSIGGHDYVTCLETDREGRFYYVSPKGLHRVSSDGRSEETIATGWRNPNGLSVSGDGVITVAPQEGEWTPASMICEVRRGGYYGYGGPRVSPDRPTGRDPPLVYLPRFIDNSSGGQVSIDSNRWGPLEGALINLSFGRSTHQLLLREVVDGMAQGAIVPLRGRFLSGVMRGRFHPGDGQLYVSGMNGWVTNAIADGCFQRVRWTGGTVCLPRSISSHENGIAIQLTSPVFEEYARDPSSWSIECWNYRYAASYGSEEWSVESPDRTGHDAMLVDEVHLSPDGLEVFLVIPGLRPVDQLHIRASLETRDGRDASFDIFQTISRLRPRREFDSKGSKPGDPASGSDRDRAEFDLVVDTHGLARGLSLEFEHVESRARDARRSRTLALAVPSGTPPTPFLPPGRFRATWRGAMLISERDRVRFEIEGEGTVQWTIDERPIVSGALDGRGALVSPRIVLGRGLRRVELVWEPPENGAGHVRVLWSGRTFPREPIPPDLLRFDPADEDLDHAEARRSGRAAILESGCLECHRPDEAGREEPLARSTEPRGARPFVPDGLDREKDRRPTHRRRSCAHACVARLFREPRGAREGQGHRRLHHEPPRLRRRPDTIGPDGERRSRRGR